MPISLRNSTSLFPWLRYSPQENKLLAQGETEPREIKFVGQSFVFDVENGITGWLLLDTGARHWKSFPKDKPVPPAPSPKHKRGFYVLVHQPKLLGGIHEMNGSTHAFNSFMEKLYNTAEPEFGKGRVPITRITAAKPIKLGMGKSMEIEFVIEKWIARPAPLVEALAKLASRNDADAKDDSAEGQRLRGRGAAGQRSAGRWRRPGRPAWHAKVRGVGACAAMLPAATRERRDKLVGMLGSEFQGEQLNALSLLRKMAAEHKIPIHELILSSPASSHSNVDAQLCEAERRAALAEQRAREAEVTRPARGKRRARRVAAGAFCGKPARRLAGAAAVNLRA